MATATKAHKYKGIWIEPCEYAGNPHGGQWAIRSFHPSGTRWADDQCDHAYTLAQAKGIVDGMVIDSECYTWHLDTCDYATYLPKRGGEDATLCGNPGRVTSKDGLERILCEEHRALF